MDVRRGLDPALLAELSKPAFYPIVFAFVDWPADPTYVHSNVGDLTWNGQTWLGVGDIGAIDLPEEEDAIVPEEAVLRLLAPLADVLENASNTAARNSAVSLWIGCTTRPGGRVLVGEPHLMFSGTLDRPDMTDDRSDDLAELKISIKTGEPARSSAQVYHSDEDQQSRYPGDTMFRRVAHGAKWRSNPPRWPA